MRLVDRGRQAAGPVVIRGGRRAAFIYAERMEMSQDNYGSPSTGPSVAGVETVYGQEPQQSGWPEQTHPVAAGDFEETVRAMQLILVPGQVTELRALGVSTPDYQRPHTVSGYFDDREALAREAMQLSPCSKGVYFVPNVLNPALLARVANHVRPVNQEPLTSDSDIIARRWLLVDIDAKRPSGISSTDAEHDAAIAKARQIREALADNGWPTAAMAPTCCTGLTCRRTTTVTPAN